MTHEHTWVYSGMNQGRRHEVVLVGRGFRHRYLVMANPHVRPRVTLRILNPRPAGGGGKGPHVVFRK